MKTPKERQLHMVKIIKALDRLLAEKHGKVGLPIVHFQKPHGAPGERESVCVYVDREKREYLPYGIDLENEIEKARHWVRDGGAPAPQLLREGKTGFCLGRPKGSETVLSLEETAVSASVSKVIDPR